MLGGALATLVATASGCTGGCLQDNDCSPPPCTPPFCTPPGSATLDAGADTLGD
jgi:hypothetical protein